MNMDNTKNETTFNGPITGSGKLVAGSGSTMYTSGSPAPNESEPTQQVPPAHPGASLNKTTFGGAIEHSGEAVFGSGSTMYTGTTQPPSTFPDQAPQPRLSAGNRSTNETTFNGPIGGSGQMVLGSGSTMHTSASSPSAAPQTVNALFVLSNPRGSDGLRLSTEQRAIGESLRLSRNREYIHGRTLLATTIDDFRRALLEQPYQILHLAGHGWTGGFVMEDEWGNAVEIPQRALAEHLQLFRSTLRCVILNACYTFALGEHIALGIPFVIAMAGPVEDEAAIIFSRGFYDAIGAGLPVDRAYYEGLSSVRLAGLDRDFLARLLRDQTPPALR